MTLESLSVCLSFQKECEPKVLLVQWFHLNCLEFERYSTKVCLKNQESGQTQIRRTFVWIDKLCGEDCA